MISQECNHRTNPHTVLILGSKIHVHAGGGVVKSKQDQEIAAPHQTDLTFDGAMSWVPSALGVHVVVHIRTKWMPDTQGALACQHTEEETTRPKSGEEEEYLRQLTEG
jgi:hypothetical protein